jgi:type I restriction enzyme R subunit
MQNVTESIVEDAVIAHFGVIGAAIKRGVEIADTGDHGDTTQVMLKGRLNASLHRVNPDLPHDTIEEVVRVLSRPPHPTLIENNRWLHGLLTDGVDVEYRDPATGEHRGGLGLSTPAYRDMERDMVSR